MSADVEDGSHGDDIDSLTLPLGVANLLEAGMDSDGGEGMAELINCAARDGRTVTLYTLLAEKVR